MQILFITLIILVICNVCVATYDIGVGIYDVTGPAVEINFMGYAVPGQRGTGIHLRLRARSFVVNDHDTNKKIAFVSVDGGMASDLVKMKVVDAVNKKLGKDVFTSDNISISGTHTHSGPAGFLQYVLYQMTSLGFVKETFDAWVNGISESIVMAHNSMEPATIKIAQGLLYDANINRSPTSYLLNPQEEIDQYPEGDTDKNMLLIKFVSEKTKKTFGVFNWFAVHATSMNNTNTLISGDNKGYAAYALEKDINGPGSTPGMGPFVSAFASSNLGDVSPNTNGAKCIDTGLDCDGTESTCNGRCEKCIAFGPGTNGDMVESTQIIGDKQYKFAKKLMETATEDITGPVDYRHTFVDMRQVNITDSKGVKKQLCSPAMGYSFAAGTTDGPGMFKFHQGETTSNPFWNKVRDFLSEPTLEEIKCQHPKPILLNTGDIEKPYAWDPTTVPLQVFRLGNLFIISVPNEFTTMSGRRLRAAAKKIIQDANVVEPGQEIYVTIAGLANSYSSYVVTNEEYQAQRYEAASTIFGPHTLEGYIQEYSRIITNLVKGEPSTTMASYPDMLDEMVEMMPGVKLDRVPKGVSFGDIVEGKDVQSTYVRGDKAFATFHSGCPRNNQHIQGTYLKVQKKKDHLDTFETVAVDGDWDTTFYWQAGKEDKYAFGFAAESYATVTWNIPADAELGTYRLCHEGDHKMLIDGLVVPFHGCSSEFLLEDKQRRSKSKRSLD